MLDAGQRLLCSSEGVEVDWPKGVVLEMLEAEVTGHVDGWDNEAMTVTLLKPSVSEGQQSFSCSDFWVGAQETRV